MEKERTTERTTDGTQQATGRDGAAGKNRRTFLTDAGKCGALLVGGTYLATTTGLENRASAQTNAPPEQGFDAKEKADMVRIFGVARRAPGMLRGDMRRKTFIGMLSYGSAALEQATKVPDNRQPLLFVMNFINEASFGEGQEQCHPLVERDFVAEYSQGVGKTVVGSMTGIIPPTPEELAAARAKEGKGPREPRPPTLPETHAERGTDLPVATKQVLAQGTRPLAVAGREKGMHFIKLAANIARADQVKTWQALHDKAMARAKVFASELVGFELLQRLPNTPDKLANRCGPELPVPELVACYWSKSKRGAGEFPTYARAFSQADQQKALDASSFFLMTEEWTVQESQQLIR